MTLDEALKIDLEPEYIQAIYDNGFVIDDHREGCLNYEYYGKCHVQDIVISIMLLDKVRQITIEWDNIDEPFFSGALDGIQRLKVARKVQKAIARLDDPSYEQIERIVSEGRAVIDRLYRLYDDIKEARKAIENRHQKEREEKKREELLSGLSPEERKHELLREKVFDELSETLIFKTKMEKANARIHDEAYYDEFEKWVLDEVDWRVSRIEEDGRADEFLNEEHS